MSSHTPEQRAPRLSPARQGRGSGCCEGLISFRGVLSRAGMT